MIGSAPLRYEMAARDCGIAEGGIGVMRALIESTGLARAIDERVHVLKAHLPYHESDHVLALAINVLCGGTCIEDLELRRRDEVLLDALGAKALPDPTTAGDFCRRFKPKDVAELMDVLNGVRCRVWRTQPTEFFDCAYLDVDGSIVETYGECKDGMDVTYDGRWGFHPLLVSLANTAEPLFLVNRPGNRPSHEGAAAYIDQAVALLRSAGFRRIVCRGDTDFEQTKFLDHWDDDGVEFIFGTDARAGVVMAADRLPESSWTLLERSERAPIRTAPRAKRSRVKDSIVEQRGYKTLVLAREHVAEFPIQPRACARPYRCVVVRKTIDVKQGQAVLYPEIRYFFYITNRHDLSQQDVVLMANDRCNQEKLIEQLKNGVPALTAPLDDLDSNWAYSIIAALAWSLKAWLALLLPCNPRWHARHESQRRELLSMSFRTFLNQVIRIPVLIVRSARRIWYRFIAWRDSIPMLFRAVNHLQTVRLE
ncbi:MAG: IS1380 family transposase [Planctomycetes bacterium]|nr:IS1380 family transposase [Planctomycetota bacterium]